MKRRLWLCGLATALVGVTSLPAPAQAVRPGPRVAHVPIEGGISQADADKFLEGRFQQAETVAAAKRLLTDLASDPKKFGVERPQDLETLDRAWQRANGQPEKLLDDAKVREIIREAAEKNGNKIPRDADERRPWDEIKNRTTSSPDAERPGPNKPPGSDRPPDDPLRPGDVDPAKPATGSTPPASPQVPPAPADPPQPSAVQDRMRDVAEALIDSPIADSPAFRRMIASFDRARGPKMPGVTAWDRRLEQIGDRFADVGTRLPKISWPRFDFSPRGPGSRVPPPPGDAVAMTGAASQVLFLLIGALAVAWLVWGLQRRRGGSLLRRGKHARPPGPWPVRPEAVRTRDELVRAFEYLALLVLGPAARHHNHREIAAGLAEHDATRGGAADRLAGLYGLARYAPPDEALPEAELAAARADLSFLAGVAAA